MIVNPIRLAILAVLAVLFPGTGFSQALPADCSAATVPAQPLAVSIGGNKFTPKLVKLRNAGGMTYGDEAFDTYRLELKSEDDFSPPLEGDVTVLVRKGQRLDGKVFRKLPVKDTDKQPAPTKGLPEIQGWSLKDRPARNDLSHVSYIGSLRLEFGQRKGNTIGGKIYLCVAKGQKTIFDPTPSKEDSSAIGTFEATIEK
jgi:hypothetical protein